MHELESAQRVVCLSTEVAHAFPALLRQCGRAAVTRLNQSDAPSRTGWNTPSDPLLRSRQRLIRERVT